MSKFILQKIAGMGLCYKDNKSCNPRVATVSGMNFSD